MSQCLKRKLLLMLSKKDTFVLILKKYLPNDSTLLLKVFLLIGINVSLGRFPLFATILGLFWLNRLRWAGKEAHLLSLLSVTPVVQRLLVLGISVCEVERLTCWVLQLRWESCSSLESSESDACCGSLGFLWVWGRERRPYFLVPTTNLGETSRSEDSGGLSTMKVSCCSDMIKARSVRK